MKFVDLTADIRTWEPYVKPYWDNIKKSGILLNGSQKEQLEQTIKSETKAEHAIAVKNGSDAITLLVGALWRPGRPVILPNFGAYPTAFAVGRATGFKDIYFVNVNTGGLTIDVDQIPQHLHNGIVISVDLFGNATLDKNLMAFCALKNHELIYDLAQATGNGTFHMGLAPYIIGSGVPNPRAQHTHGILSFYPTKPIGSWGDGGMVVTNNSSVAQAVRKSSFYNYEGNSRWDILGINSRMDEWQCAVVNAKFNNMHIINKQNKKLDVIAERFESCLPQGVCVRFKERRDKELFHANHLFPIIFPTQQFREDSKKKFTRAGIPTMEHYPKHVSQLPVFFDPTSPDPSPILTGRMLSIPFHPYLKPKEVELICKTLKKL